MRSKSSSTASQIWRVEDVWRGRLMLPWAGFGTGRPYQSCVTGPLYLARMSGSVRLLMS